MQIKSKIVSCHTADSIPVIQEVNGTVILPPLVFPGKSRGFCVHLLHRIPSLSKVYLYSSYFGTNDRTAKSPTFQNYRMPADLLLEKDGATDGIRFGGFGGRSMDESECKIYLGPMP